MLAAGVFAALLLTAGPLRAVLVLVAAALQVGLHLVTDRAHGPSSWRRFPVLWSVQASLTWLVAGDPTTVSVVVYIAIGLVFALVAEVVLRAVGRFAAADDDTGSGREPTDTAPLPVHDSEG